MAKKYRVEEVCFINDDKKTTRTVYLPQVKFNDGWCCFPDEETPSGVIEYTDEQSALDNAKTLYEHYHDKGSC